MPTLENAPRLYKLPILIFLLNNIKPILSLHIDQAILRIPSPTDPNADSAKPSGESWDQNSSFSLQH